MAARDRRGPHREGLGAQARSEPQPPPRRLRGHRPQRFRSSTRPCGSPCHIQAPVGEGKKKSPIPVPDARNAGFPFPRHPIKPPPLPTSLSPVFPSRPLSCGHPPASAQPAPPFLPVPPPPLLLQTAISIVSPPRRCQAEQGSPRPPPLPATQSDRKRLEGDARRTQPCSLLPPRSLPGRLGDPLPCPAHPPPPPRRGPLAAAPHPLPPAPWPPPTRGGYRARRGRVSHLW